MQIKFKCECGQTLKVASDAAGKTGKCPACGRQVEIPTMEEIQAQPLPVQIVSEPAQPEASDTALKEVPAPPIPQARPAAAAQPTSETGLKEAPEEGAVKKPFAPKGKSALDRFRERRAKPAAGLRTRRGVRVKARGEEEEEEEEYAPSDKRKKQLITAGVIAGLVVIGLIVLYAAYFAPRAEQAQRIEDYKKTAFDFTGKVRDLCTSYAEKEIPISLVLFRNRVNDVKSAFESGVKPVTEGHSQMLALGSYKDMETVINKLDRALRLVEERAQVDQDREQTPESRKERVDKINSDFQAIIKDCSALTTSIEKAVRALRLG